MGQDCRQVNIMMARNLDLTGTTTLIAILLFNDIWGDIVPVLLVSGEVLWIDWRWNSSLRLYHEPSAHPQEEFHTSSKYSLVLTGTHHSIKSKPMLFDTCPKKYMKLKREWLKNIMSCRGMFPQSLEGFQNLLKYYGRLLCVKLQASRRIRDRVGNNNSRR